MKRSTGAVCLAMLLLAAMAVQDSEGLRECGGRVMVFGGEKGSTCVRAIERARGKDCAGRDS